MTGATILDTRRNKENGLYPVKYRVTFQRKTVYYKSGYDLSESDWLIIPDTQKRDLAKTRNLIKSGFDVIESHVKEIKDKFSFMVLDRRLGRGNTEFITTAFESRIIELENAGQVGTASIYKTAKGFFDKPNLKFSDITPK